MLFYCLQMVIGRGKWCNITKQSSVWFGVCWFFPSLLPVSPHLALPSCRIAACAFSLRHYHRHLLHLADMHCICSVRSWNMSVNKVVLYYVCALSKLNGKYLRILIHWFLGFSEHGLSVASVSMTQFLQFSQFCSALAEVTAAMHTHTHTHSTL